MDQRTSKHHFLVIVPKHQLNKGASHLLPLLLAMPSSSLQAKPKDTLDASRPRRRRRLEGDGCQ